MKIKVLHRHESERFISMTAINEYGDLIEINIVSLEDTLSKAVVMLVGHKPPWRDFCTLNLLQWIAFAKECQAVVKIVTCDKKPEMIIRNPDKNNEEWDLFFD